jgi:hypothetical protein
MGQSNQEAWDRGARDALLAAGYAEEEKDDDGV